MGPKQLSQTTIPYPESISPSLIGQIFCRMCIASRRAGRPLLDLYLATCIGQPNKHYINNHELHILNLDMIFWSNEIRRARLNLIFIIANNSFLGGHQLRSSLERLLV